MNSSKDFLFKECIYTYKKMERSWSFDDSRLCVPCVKNPDIKNGYDTDHADSWRKYYNYRMKSHFLMQLDVWKNVNNLLKYGPSLKLPLLDKDPKKCQKSKILLYADEDCLRKWLKTRCHLCGQQFKYTCNIFVDFEGINIMCWRCAVFWKPENMKVNNMFHCSECYSLY